MKIICERDILSSAVATVSRAVSARSSLSVLEGVYLRAEQGGKVTLIGNDLEIGIEAVIDADVIEAGEVVIKAKMFGGILTSLGDNTVTIETDGNNLTLVKSGKAKFEIPGISADEFPDLPRVDEDYSVSLPGRVLREMIEKTVFAAAKSDNDPTRMGALFKIQKTGLTMVALDGYRIALRRADLPNDFDEREMIVPEKSLSEIAKIIGDSEEDVRIAVTPGHANFMFENCRLVTRLIEGSFTNYERILPTSFELELVCSRHQLAESVKRASLIILNDLVKGPIRFNITDGNINVSCATSAGSVDDNIAVDTPPDTSLEIGFFNRYLQDVFGAVRDDEIMMKFNKSINPLVITPVEGNEYEYIILPIKLSSRG